MTASPQSIAELADEYVLGLLEPAETAAVEERLKSDAELRAAVAAARERFLEFDLAAPPLTPSQNLWGRIADGAARPTTSSPARSGEIRERARRAAATTVGGWWRPAAMASFAASLLLVAALGWTLWSGPPVQVIAVLVDEEGEPLVVVEVLPANAVRVTPIGDLDLPADRALELWTLPDPDAGPVSIGLLQEVAARTLIGPDLPAPQPEQLYEISVEAPGGSPVGRPTGPVLVKGFARLPR